MTDAALPERIFMATDLSARCDRALARAARLAGAWRAELLVAHVVAPDEVASRDRLAGALPSWHRPESCTQALERALREDLAGEGIVAASRVVVGTPADAVQQAVAEDGAGLVVLGIAKDARMERIQLGSTVDSLVRESRVPVLNVRLRARAEYRHVVVATDFLEPARHALRVAANWFPDARLTLFHACTAPGSVESWQATVARQRETHLAEAALPQPVAERLESIVERGRPEDLMADYVASTGADLVVLGSHGRTGVVRALLGSTAEDLLHRLDCDTLVVRAG